MSADEKTLINEIRYHDYVRSRKIWIKIVIWPAILGTIIVALTHPFAAEWRWSVLQYAAVVFSVVFLASLTTVLIPVFFGASRVHLDSGFLYLSRMCSTRKIPIEELQMCIGVLSDDCGMPSARAIPCVLARIESERSVRYYAVTHEEVPEGIRKGGSRVWQLTWSVLAFILTVLGGWGVGVMTLGLAYKPLSRGERLSRSFMEHQTVHMWVTFWGGIFVGFYIARLVWYSRLKAKRLLDSVDEKSTSAPISEFFANIIGLGIISSALPFPTVGVPIAYLSLLILGMSIYAKAGQIVRSGRSEIEEKVRLRKELAREVVSR